jgi:hypothetical protein
MTQEKARDANMDDDEFDFATDIDVVIGNTLPTMNL